MISSTEKPEVKQQINRTKSIYTTDEIRKIFSNRRDDEMFMQLGQMTRRAKDKNENDLIWRGYHVLIDSEYSEV